MPVIEVIDKESGEIVSLYRTGLVVQDLDKLMESRHDPETQLWKIQGEPEAVEIGNDEVSTGVQAVLDEQAKKAAAEEKARKAAEKKAAAEAKKAAEKAESK